MHGRKAKAVLLLLAGALVLGLLALAWMLGPGASQAQQGAMHNCPQPSKWAIAVWDGDDGTDAEQAFATCGAVPVAAAYYIDPDTQVWSRWFAGRPEMSNLTLLNNMQGLLVFGQITEGTPTATPTAPDQITLEGEAGTGDGQVKSRTAASGQETVLLHDGESQALSFQLPAAARYSLTVRYSNDNYGPLETVSVSVDDAIVGQFEAQDTGDFGAGWNVFESSGPIGSVDLQAGTHEVTVSVAGGDGYGVEIDVVTLDCVG